MSQRVGVFLLVAIGVSAQTPIEPRIVSETLPAGGLMQIKLELTSPHPITTSGADFQMELAFDGVEGVAMLSPAGDAYGVAAHPVAWSNRRPSGGRCSLANSARCQRAHSGAHGRPRLRFGIDEV